MSFNNLSVSLLFVISSLFFPYVSSLTFNISSFDQGSTSLIEQQGDAFIKDGKIKLTENSVGLPKANSSGRAIYKQEIVLWDEKTRELTDFKTHFSFIIKCSKGSYCGDGMTFFLAKHTETIPEGSGGGRLALYGSDINNTENGFVAVEFDSFKNYFDPSADHVGIDIDSVVSVANVSLNSSIKDGRTGNAWVAYNSSTHIISVFLTYVKNPVYKTKPTLSYKIDLRDVLPSRVAAGFSASTGLAAETHEILSWSFSSRLKGKTQDFNNHTVAESPKQAVLSPVKPPETAVAPPEEPKSPKKAVSPVKPPETAVAPPVEPKSPETAKSPEISDGPDNTKIGNSANTNKSNVALIVGLAASIGAILFL